MVLWYTGPPGLSLPGIGELSVAAILSGFGHFRKFQNASKILSFASIELSYSQSSSLSLPPHGQAWFIPVPLWLNERLFARYITNKPFFAEYYAKKRVQGKPYRVALTDVTKTPLGHLHDADWENPLRPNNDPIKYIHSFSSPPLKGLVSCSRFLLLKILFYS